MAKPKPVVKEGKVVSANRKFYVTIGRTRREIPTGLFVNAGDLKKLAGQTVSVTTLREEHSGHRQAARRRNSVLRSGARGLPYRIDSTGIAARAAEEIHRSGHHSRLRISWPDKENYLWHSSMWWWR